MYDVRISRSLTLTMIMLLSALSPILMPVYADHEDEGGENSGNNVSLSIFDNSTSSWELISPFQTQFLEEGTHEMEIRSTNLNLNDTYELTWHVSMEEFTDSSYVEENRTWIAYNNESSESFNITVNEFTCWIMINYELINQSTSSTVDYGFYEFLGPCGNNGVIFTNIEIDGNDTLVESFHGPDLWDNMLVLEPGTYDMWFSTGGSGTFTSGNDYLVEWNREVEGSSNYSHTEGMYNWTAGSQSGIGLGSLGWNITVDSYTCAIVNDAMLWEAEYFADGEWDKDNSTLMGTTITDMQGPCGEIEYPDVELYYDNGSGPVMYEMVWDYEEFDNCSQYDDGYWECDVDYDGDGYPDDYYGFEHCEWDNNSMMYWCAVDGEVPHLESNLYEFIANISNLEIGADYQVYANYYLNTQNNYETNYEWISWNNSNESHIIDGLYLDIDQYMCSLNLQFTVYMDGNDIMDGEFSFNGDCEEMSSPFELYYDNGTGPIMWEPVIEYEAFDNCSQYDDGYWECEVDYDNDGDVDWYYGFEHCEWDNNSMMYWCEMDWNVPMLEPGNYTFTLNVSGLEVGEWHELEWMINDDFDGISFNATDEYEHFEWDIEIDQYMCEFIMEFNLVDYNGMEFYDNFEFNGLCEEMPDPPSPFELYYDNGTGPIMWEPIWNYEQFDNCSQYDDGHWECEVDYNNDGNVDWYNYYEDCMWDNNSMTYWCAAWYDYPMLEAGDYTFTLNVSGLEVGEWHELEWWFNGVYDGMSFNATDEYEHFEWDIEIDEYMCYYSMQFHLMHYNGMEFYDNFEFNGLCEEMPSPFELYYDNGTGPVMWEPVVNYESFDNCYQYDDGYWECDVDYDGDGYPDDYYGFEHCEWDNNSMMYWCEMGWNDPMLEPGDYTFTLNVSGLEVGEWHELEWWFNGAYDGMSFNATDEYEHFEWDIEIDEYMCGFWMQVHLMHYNGMHFGDYFSFNTYCEEPVSDHFFELYYDNGTEVMKWEPTITYEEFDNCDELEEGHWECEVDHDGDGYIDHYAHFRDCMWDNNSMTYWCEAHHMPLLEPGDYTLILNATMLVIDTDYKLDWRLHFEGFDHYDESMNTSWTASEEYEHIEWDIEVDESMCMMHSDVEMRTDNTNNSTYGFAHFAFNGLCQEPPQPLELYFNGILFDDMMVQEDESNVPHLEAGTNYMSWSMIGLEVGDEYNLTWSLVQMSMFDEDMEEEEPNIEIFAADSEEMMYDWEAQIDNDTCMVMIVGVLSINGSENDWSGMLGMVWAMFNGPCEIEMGDVGLDMLNPDDGNWYEMYGMNGSESFAMMISMMDEEQVVMDMLENSPELETGNYTMRWVFEDLEVGKEYIVFMEDIMQEMYDNEPEFAYHDNCSEEYNEEDDEWYWLCYVENDDGSIDYLSYEYCYEYDDGMYECDLYDNEEDILTTFNASSESEYYEWELIITDDTCGHVFLVGLVDAESGEDGFPSAMSMYAIAGPNMDNCFGNNDEFSPEDWLNMADYDGDGNMSWDEFISVIDDEIDNETINMFYQFFVESDWNGDGTLDIEELSYFLPMVYSLEPDDNDGPSPEDWMYMTDMDGDGNMSWDEFISFVEDDESLDNETFELFYGFFMESDWNGDGTLDIEELSYFLPLVWSTNDNGDGMDIEDLMNMADYDGDGNINWDEFYEFAYNSMEGDDIDNATWDYWADEFEGADGDGDGQLNMEELNEFWNRIMSPDDDGMDIEDLMNMADYDGDGNINWDEFYEFAYNSMEGDDIDNATWDYWADEFEGADGDGDGQLNMEELNEFWNRIMSPDDDWDLEDFAVEQHWTVSLGFTDGANFTFYLGATQMLSDDFKSTADMLMGDGDGYLNSTEAEQVYFWLLDNLDTNPEGPENITLNGIPAEIVFVGYDIMDLSHDNPNQPAIMSMWDLIFHNVESNSDGHYTFEYMENIYDEGLETQANFCAVSYDYSYQIMDFVWNGTNIDPADINECISLDIGEIVPSFSITYGQETNIDYDNDGVNNEDDAFPYDPSESMDTDGDGWGDNSDVFPEDDTEWLDTDGDGIGDNADTDYDGDGTDDSMEDSDGDGVNDAEDDFPNDANESTDTDGDGVGDNSDVFPDDANESSDLDGDGIGDNSDDDADGDGTPNDVDAFPLTDSSNDADNDGVANDLDHFPNDPNEYFDSDGDGVGDNADTDDDDDGVLDSNDAFPYDPSETMDTDGDGLGDNADEFPNDATERVDSDGDGIGDNSDEFPSDTTEWADTDGDGVGDNSDAFPNDASEIVDSDGDGVGNNADAFPYDANEQSDSDGNGVGDNAQADQENGGTTPVDPEPVDDDGGFLPGFSAVMGIISMLGAAILVAGRRKD